MQDVAAYVRWRDFLGVSAVTLVGLMIAGALRGGPLLSPTALVGYPVAVAVCAFGFALLRRRCRDGDPTH